MHFGNFTDIKGVSQEFSELIFTDMLEIHGILKAFIYCRYTSVFTPLRYYPKPQHIDFYKMTKEFLL
jgi:hypothetical protein